MSESFASSFIRKTRAETPDIALEKISSPDLPSRPLQADEEYVSVRLRRLWVPFSRKGAQKYHGCVHSEIKTNDERHGEATFQTVSTSETWMKAPSSDLDRVLVQDLYLLQHVPYRGPLKLQLALFTMPAQDGDLAAPYLKMLQKLGNAAGVGMVHAAMEFAGPIRDGVDLLLGARHSSELEVGLITDAVTETGTWLLSRAPHETARDLRLTAKHELVDADDNPAKQYPYLVFSVEASTIRPDYMKIPEIRRAHDDLMQCIRQKKLTNAEKEALPAFRRACVTSPDLILSHATELAEREKRRFNAAIEPQKVSKSGAEITTWELGELDLFDLAG